MSRGIIAAILAAAAIGCTDVGDYSTSFGECYAGEIVGAPFVRSGFAAGTTLSLTIDADGLGRGAASAGYLTSSDGRFEETPVVQLEQLAHDNLSLMQFPGGRVKNFLTHASIGDRLATVVISLMENEDVEVRVLLPGDGAHEPLFGVFHLLLREDCAMLQPGD